MILVATNGASLKCLLTDGSSSRLTQCCFLQFKLTNEVGNFCFFFFLPFLLGVGLGTYSYQQDKENHLSMNEIEVVKVIGWLQLDGLTKK